MNLLDDLINSIREDAPVRSEQIGANWVVVCSRFCGMASALRGEHKHGISDVKEASSLHHKSAKDLAQLVYSSSVLEASIARHDHHRFFVLHLPDFLEPFLIGATCAWCLTSSVVMTGLQYFALSPAKQAFLSI